MRYAVGLLLLGACTITMGCAQGPLRGLTLEDALSVHTSPYALSDEGAAPKDAPGKRQSLRAGVLTLVEGQAEGYEETDEVTPEPIDEGSFADDRGPEEVLPEPADAPAFEPGAGEVDIDRFTRRVTEVSLDIRTTAGAMPEDVSVLAFPETPIPSEPGPAPDRVEVPVAYSPWTICYRPLYF